MLSDSSITSKRPRSTHDPPVESPSARSAATRKSLAKKSLLVHRFLLPQCLEEFDQWPANLPGLLRSFLKSDDGSGGFRAHLGEEKYLDAWKNASKATQQFMEEHLLPAFDELRNRQDGSTVLLAFVGLRGMLGQISEMLSQAFVANFSDDFISEDYRSVEEKLDDAIEEIDIGEFFGKPSHNLSDGSSCGSLGLKCVNFEGSSSPQDTSLNRQEFVPGSVPTKRRRTTTPEDEDLVDARSLSQLSISGTLDRNGTHATVVEPNSHIHSTEQIVDIEHLEELPEGMFRQNLCHFTVGNIFRYFARLVVKRLEVFPVIAAPFVHNVAEIYEKLIQLQQRAVSTAAPDSDASVELKAALVTFHKALTELGLGEAVIAPALQILCRRKVKDKAACFLKDCVNSDFTYSFRKETEFPVLSAFVHSTMTGDASRSSLQILQRLIDYTKKEYIEGVVDGFFDLLLQWPRSRQNFIELKHLMDQSSQDVVQAVIISLQRQFYSRLLRPGLNTQDILAVYTAAIRALRIIDPSRVIQDLVCEPVRFYLRSRPDTVRCIMSHITHISPIRDTGDNRRNSLPALDAMIEEEEAAIALTMLNPKNSTSDIDMENWRTWQPDPVYVELLPSHKRTDRQADTIELLMSIYGGQDVFINEYQLILAEKLLGYYPFDSDEESKHLKMMTKRFGESLLQKSEVMSRDAADSQRFHNRILTKMDLTPIDHKTIPLTGLDNRIIPLKTLIISHNYWPEIRTEKIKAPDNLNHAMTTYRQRFEEASETRTFEIRPELGRVEFDLHLDDGRTMHLKCNPVYIAIILQFAAESRWSLDDLAEKIGLAGPIVKKKLVYWQRRNVLEESEPDVFSVVPEGTFLSQEDLRRMDDEEIESAVRYVAENNQEEQNMQVQLQTCWKYMTTMLCTVQTITIDKLFHIVRMLTLRGQAKKEDVTIDHLRQLLDGKVRARELVYANNRYSLPKKEVKEVRRLNLHTLRPQSSATKEVDIMHIMAMGHWEKGTQTTVSFYDSRGLPWLPRTLCPEIEFHATDDGVIPRLPGSSAPNSNFIVHGTDDGVTPRLPGSSVPKLNFMDDAAEGHLREMPS
ncbi:Anaphase-promoting complex subunit 2 [Hypsibius exemplaris]|uniref:Anaphase-promoting complex subunit 2 n=1 Tax=Hypsibius exemplaris TaxID=2072580 RepID=A0A1W0XCF8_HYPEX|nr:Anaphase-promoting complex subunit 2 [Hypsibius exemplaris]